MKEQLNNLWCEILGLSSVGNDDKFYEIGGNSITFLLLLEEVDNRFHIKLPLENVYDYETVNKMAEYIEKLS